MAVNKDNKLKAIILTDIHFGHKRSSEMYEELQMVLDDMSDGKYNMLILGGDYFDRRLMGNEPAITYALLFFDKLVDIVKEHNMMIRIIEGTRSHDMAQYETLLQQYLNDPDLNIKYFKETTLETIDGIDFLFVPEEYPKHIKNHYTSFIEKGCDVMIGHGMWSFVGMGDFEDNSETQIEEAPVFSYAEWGDSINMFAIFGHIHKRQDYKSKIFYPGSFTAWGFGDISDKGYATFEIDLEKKSWEVDMKTNDKTPKYQSLKITDLVAVDNFDGESIPVLKDLIDEVAKGYDFTKISLNGLDDSVIKLLRETYRYDRQITLDVRSKKKVLLEGEGEDSDKNELYSKYNYILSGTVKEEDVIIQYLKEEHDYTMTNERLNELLSEKDD